jgi:hypothetical protein
MTELELIKEMEHLLKQRHSLEEEAGISSAMELARRERYIPQVEMGDRTAPDEEFLDEYRQFVYKLRDTYFSVQDDGLRLKLIAVQMRIDGYKGRSFKAEIEAANFAASVATTKIQNPPWTKAALIGVCAVIVGYLIFGLVGAIAGAVGGFFIGQGFISTAKNNAIADHDKAVHKLERAQEGYRNLSRWPSCFSHDEETRGKCQ